MSSPKRSPIVLGEDEDDAPHPPDPARIVDLRHDDTEVGEGGAARSPPTKRRRRGRGPISNDEPGPGPANRAAPAPAPVGVAADSPGDIRLVPRPRRRSGIAPGLGSGPGTRLGAGSGATGAPPPNPDPAIPSCPHAARRAPTPSGTSPVQTSANSAAAPAPRAVTPRQERAVLRARRRAEEEEREARSLRLVQSLQEEADAVLARRLAMGLDHHHHQHQHHMAPPRVLGQAYRVFGGGGGGRAHRIANTAQPRIPRMPQPWDQAIPVEMFVQMLAMGFILGGPEGGPRDAGGIHGGGRDVPLEVLMAMRGNRDFTAEDYDLLLRLDETVTRNEGATAAQIEAQSAVETLRKTAEAPCTVCLEEIEVGAEVRRLPCTHAFHTACIDPWLTQKASCPVCLTKLDI